MGEDTSYTIKNANLIQRLEGVPDEKRTARFVCAIAAVFTDGRSFETRSTIEGRIGYEEKGSGGFGYDPIFFVPEYGKTTAELTEEEKNAIVEKLITWAKAGGYFRRKLALAAIFFLLVYYHSIGKRVSVPCPIAEEIL